MPDPLPGGFLSVVFVKFLICSNIIKLVHLQVTDEENQKLKLFPNISHDPNDIHFYLFLRPSGNGPVEEIKYLNDFSLARSKFIPNALTVIYVHGYADSFDDKETSLVVINAYLSSEIRGNFISVDWKKLSNPPGPLNPVDFLTGYLEVLPIMPIVGKRVAEFICWLCQKDALQFSQVHIIGHSLGAHVAGDAGSTLQEFSDGQQVWRITGLDPAGPLLEWPLKLEKVLNKNDAKFVDAIHTSAGFYGNIEPNADVDIYVNNGVVQPGCWSPIILETVICSHEFAIRVYVSGFSRLEIACGCPSWRFYFGLCQDDPCTDPIIVGPYSPEWARGIFHLSTSANP